MGEAVAGRAGKRPIRYEIVVVGEMRPGQARVLEDLSVRAEGGRSVITGDIVDQSQLHGILDWLGDSGIEIVSVTPVTAGNPQ